MNRVSKVLNNLMYGVLFLIPTSFLVNSYIGIRPNYANRYFILIALVLLVVNIFLNLGKEKKYLILILITLTIGIITKYFIDEPRYFMDNNITIALTIFVSLAYVIISNSSISKKYFIPPLILSGFLIITMFDVDQQVFLKISTLVVLSLLLIENRKLMIKPHINNYFQIGLLLIYLTIAIILDQLAIYTVGYILAILNIIIIYSIYKSVNRTDYTKAFLVLAIIFKAILLILLNTLTINLTSHNIILVIFILGEYLYIYYKDLFNLEKQIYLIPLFILVLIMAFFIDDKNQLIFILLMILNNLYLGFLTKKIMEV